jgi:hypothetical protein
MRRRLAVRLARPGGRSIQVTKAAGREFVRYAGLEVGVLLIESQQPGLIRMLFIRMLMERKGSPVLVMCLDPFPRYDRFLLRGRGRSCHWAIRWQPTHRMECRMEQSEFGAWAAQQRPPVLAQK